MSSVSAYLRRNVLGLVAIFLALSGGAYAAGTVSNRDLDTGSIDSRTLAAGAVQGPDIHSHAVGPKKIKLELLVDRLQKRVTGTCPEGESVQGVLTTGAVICAKGSEGTITGITPADGLTGGGTAGNVDLGVDSSVIQSRVDDACPANQAIDSIAADGTVGCEPAGSGTVTSVGSGFGLSGGPVTTSGNLAADPTVLQRRVSGTCSSGQAVQGVAQDGTVSCSQAFANRTVAQNSGYVQVNDDPSQSATLLDFGGLIVRATCSPGGNAKVEIGSNGGPGQFLNYQVDSTTKPDQGGSVGNGDFLTVTDTATNERGDFNVLTNSFHQLDGSYLAWATATTGGVDCVFHASALAF